MAMRLGGRSREVGAMIYRITINDGEEFDLESMGLPDSPLRTGCCGIVRRSATLSASGIRPATCSGTRS